MFIRLIFQTMFSALSQMAANKVRAALTTLGIIIGVWAITVVIAAVGALNSSVLKNFEEFGANKLELWGQVPDAQRGKIGWDTVRITPAEIKAIREHAGSVESIALYCNLRATIRAGDVEKSGVRVTAIEPEWLEIQKRVILEGRPLTENDNTEELQVCLVNDTAINELHLNDGGVGQFVSINDRRFQVVGVLETKEFGAMFGGGEARTEVYVPLPLGYKLAAVPWPQAVAKIRSTPDGAGEGGVDLVQEVQEEIKFILRTQRQIPPDKPDTFNMFVFESIVRNMRAMGAGLTMGASLLVGISLLVGGVGIMNVMLVSVSERTREIGLRKAVGANPVVILMQFLIEAIILCMSGGMIGLIIGQTTVLGLQQLEMGNRMFSAAEIPVWAIVLAFSFSAGVGIVFGMGPAIKAARLDPIEALRHE